MGPHGPLEGVPAARVPQACQVLESRGDEPGAGGPGEGQRRGGQPCASRGQLWSDQRLPRRTWGPGQPPPAGVWRRCASLKGRPPPWGPTGSEAVDATAADVFLGGFGLKEPGKHVTPFQRKGPGLAGRTRRTGSTCGPGQQVGRSVHPGGHAGRPPALWPLSPRLSCPAVTGTQDGAQRRDRQRNPRPLSSGPSRSSETRTR